MILANEIREGIYLEYENNGISVKIIGFKDGICYYNSSCYSKIESMTPIPLTEDILLKCGFDKHEYQYIIEYCINSFKLRYIKKNKKYVYHTGFRNIEKRYLHQLQNIYLDLEEKELEVNL